MAIHPILRSALKALSYAEPDIKKTYKLERQIEGRSGERMRKAVKTRNRKYRALYTVWDHRIYCDGLNIPIRIFEPERKNFRETLPALLFFHGGGWVKGNIDSYSRVCANLASLTRHLVISVDYRLAPEHRFPKGLSDCYKVAEELFTKGERLNIIPEQITLIGDSAGGNLAAAVSLMARDKGVFLPCRQILIYPSTGNDHSETSPFASVRENGTDYLLTSKRICDYMELYAEKPEDRFNPYFAPLLAENLDNQPDTLIITAQYDPLRDEAEAYGQRLSEAGNRAEIYRAEDGLHGFFSLPVQFELVRQCYERIRDFLYENQGEEMESSHEG